MKILKRVLFQCALVILLSGASFGQSAVLISFNIRYDNKADLENNWNNRKSKIIQLILNYEAPILGIQEGLPDQVDYMDSCLTDYDYIGVGREDGMRQGEHCAIFYDRTKFRPVRDSTFWLSETPGIPSVGWDAALERICTYGLFEDLNSRSRIWILNTHFDHRGAEARENSARLLLDRIKQINKENLPLLLMGDFNATPGEMPVEILKTSLADALELSEKPLYGPPGTSNGFTDDLIVRRIDYFFTENLKVKSYTHIDDRLDNNKHVSDHLPVMVKIEYPHSHPAAKPLYRDPVYDGAADPSIVWNRAEKKWFMFYTNRRASAEGLDGVSWVHGTRIGIAESADGGRTWQYRDTCDIRYRMGEYTHWAPEVLEHNGMYHMFLTYVPGIFTDWKHPRRIVHLTSTNLIEWEFESTLELSSERCIDACIFRLPDGTWRMYYNNESDGKSMYYADSPDLYKWNDSGKKVVGDRSGEGPKVFFWKGAYRMIVDNWNGLGIYSSGDLINWSRQKDNILSEPGEGQDDGVIGQHPDVLVQGDRAYVFYFTHPGRTIDKKGRDNYQTRRSSIQVAELQYEDGHLTCDRNKPVFINLSPPWPE